MTTRLGPIVTMWMRRSILSLIPGLFLGGALFAQAASQDTVLTLRNPNLSGVYGTLWFSEADLKAFPQVTITTSNDFVDGIRQFRGPRAFDVIDQIGRAGLSRVRLTALNEYSVDIPLADIEKFQPILAMEMDGVALTSRDNGPIWLIYPRDSYPELHDALYNNRMIWQLSVMELY